MSELKLRTVSIRNWMTIRQADLEFPDKGLVLVVGQNTASNGKMESVGSGKTALGEAISRALVGVSGRFANLGHYSFKSKGNMYVKVGCELAGKPLMVEIGHRCKELSSTGEGIRFQHGEQAPVERGHPRETRDELSGILGVTPNLAAWTVYIDGDKLRFNSQSEKESVSLLMTALRQPSWDAYQKQASTILNGAKASLAQAEGAHEGLKQDIADCTAAVQQSALDVGEEAQALTEAEAEYKQAAKRVQDTIDTHQEHIDKLGARQKEIKKALKTMEDECAKDYADLEKQQATLSTKVSQHQIKRTKVIESRADAKSKWQTEANKLSDLKSEPEKCPTCGKKWDKQHSVTEIKDQEKHVSQLKGVVDGFALQITDIDKFITVTNADAANIVGQIRALRSPAKSRVLSQEYETNDESIDSRTATVSNLRLELKEATRGPDRSRYERLKAVQQERKKALEQKTKALENASQGLVEAQATVQVASYWYEAFGPTGIPNMILAEAIPPLNEIAKRLSLLMTGGSISVTYDTARELASGLSSAELVVKVDNKLGSQRAEGSSKGEAGLTNLIIAETLSEVGSVSNRIGYRWYDEVLNNQDPVVRRSILSYLRDLANRLGIVIFVVDHHQETASYVDYVLVAEKTKEGTSLFWR